jgi:type I restriction enzyme S subunit
MLMSKDVPVVYKLTEVGVIPEDWKVLPIAELQPFVTSGSRGWAGFYSERGYPFIRITNLSRESIYPDLNDLKLVNLPLGVSEGTRTQLQDNDLLISITADIGIIGYVSPLIPKPSYINQHIALVRFDSSKVSSKFISYFLASENPQKLFWASTDTGAKAGMSLIPHSARNGMGKIIKKQAQAEDSSVGRRERRNLKYEDEERTN